MGTWFGFTLVDFSNPAIYWQTFILIGFAYLFGSINFGRILSIMKKKSLAEVGSGNFGSTNAGRAFGAKGFLFVFIGDTLKPLAASLIMIGLVGFKYPYGYVGVLPYASISVAMLFCIVGHIWPIYFKFKGGKGVATTAGVVFAINWYVGLVGLFAMGLAVFFTRRVSLSALICILTGAIFLTLSGLPNIWGWNLYLESLGTFSLSVGVVFTGWMAFAIVLYTHRENIKRLFKRQESVVEGVKEFRSKVFKVANGKYSLYSLFTHKKNKSRIYDKDKMIQPADWRRFTEPVDENKKNTSETKIINEKDLKTNKK